MIDTGETLISIQSFCRGKNQRMLVAGLLLGLLAGIGPAQAQMQSQLPSVVVADNTLTSASFNKPKFTFGLTPSNNHTADFSSAL